MRVLAKPAPTNTTPTTPVNSTAPTSTVATTSSHMPVTRSTATSILAKVYKLGTEQFAEVPCPNTRPQNEGSNPPLLKDIPSAHLDRLPLGPTQSASENLFENRKDWPIPPAPIPTPFSTIKTFARTRKSMKRTGMAICRTNQECAPRILNASNQRIAGSHLTYPIGMLNR